MRPRSSEGRHARPAPGARSSGNTPTGAKSAGRERMSHDPAVPAPFEPVFAHLEEIRYTEPGSRFHQCFGCGPNHDIGLRVRTFRGEGEVLSPIVIPKRFEGPPEGAHGGIVSPYLREGLAGGGPSHNRPPPPA